MAEIVNLRLARKRKARDEAAEAAAQARVTHGRSKAEKSLDRARAEKAERDVEAHRLAGPAVGPAPNQAGGPVADQATGPATGPVPPQVRDTADPKPR